MWRFMTVFGYDATLLNAHHGHAAITPCLLDDHPLSSEPMPSLCSFDLSLAELLVACKTAPTLASASHRPAASRDGDCSNI